MAADIDNILKERSKEVTFTDNGYENVEDIFKLEEEADSGKQLYGYQWLVWCSAVCKCQWVV